MLESAQATGQEVRRDEGKPSSINGRPSKKREPGAGVPCERKADSAPEERGAGVRAAGQADAQ